MRKLNAVKARSHGSTTAATAINSVIKRHWSLRACSHRMTVKKLHLRMDSIDINESVNTRKSFVAVASVSCEWIFWLKKGRD